MCYDQNVTRDPSEPNLFDREREPEPVEPRDKAFRQAYITEKQRQGLSYDEAAQKYEERYG